MYQIQQSSTKSEVTIYKTINNKEEKANVFLNDKYKLMSDAFALKVIVIYKQKDIIKEQILLN